jgi:hypothetical protein
VAKQACLICGGRPADAHHLRFAQHRALGRKVSDCKRAAESPHFGACNFSPLGGDDDQPFERSGPPVFGGRPRRLIGAVDD